MMSDYNDFCKSVSDLCNSCDNLGYQYDIHRNTTTYLWELRIFGSTIIPSVLIKSIPDSRRFFVTSFPRKGRDYLCLLVY